MFRFFSLEQKPEGGIYGHSYWVNIKARYQTTFDLFINYYRNNIMAVSYRHDLYRTIMHYGEGHSMDFNSWYGYLRESYLEYAASTYFTTPISIGKIKKGTFFGPGISEIYIAISEPFDVLKVTQNWQNIKAVRILSHPRSDLQFNILSGLNNTNAQGYAVIAIDIPLLMVQYKAYRESEKLLRNDKDIRYSPLQFIHQFVLPQLIYDQIDHALLNRFYNKVFQLDNNIAKYQLPIYISDWSRFVDEVQSDQLIWLETHNTSFVRTLLTLRCANKKSQFENLRLPDLFRSRQISWALALSRFKALEVLLEIDKRQKSEINRRIKNQLKQQIIRYRSDQSFANVLRRDHLNYVLEQINRIEKYL